MPHKDKPSQQDILQKSFPGSTSFTITATGEKFIKFQGQDIPFQTALQQATQAFSSKSTVSDLTRARRQAVLSAGPLSAGPRLGPVITPIEGAEIRAGLRKSPVAVPSILGIPPQDQRLIQPDQFQSSRIDIINQDILAQQQASKIQIDDEEKDLTSRTERILEGFAEEREDRGEELERLEEDEGLKETRTKRRGLLAKIDQLSASLLEGLAALDAEPLPATIKRGRRAVLQQQTLAKIASLQAQERALARDITGAEEAIERQLDIKFGSEAERLFEQRALLDAAKADFNAEEKIEAEKRELQIDLALGQLEELRKEERDNAKRNLDLILQIAEGGGDPSVVNLDADFQSNVIKAKEALEKIGRDKDTDPLLEAIRLLDIRAKEEAFRSFISVPATAQTEQFINGFRNAVSEGSEVQQKLRGRDFSSALLSGNFERGKNIILRAAVETSLAEEQRFVTGRSDAISSLLEIDDIFDEIEELGVNTNIVKGGFENLLRKLGESSNPKLVELKTRLAVVLFSYRRAVTGVQFSARESLQYEAIFPNYINLPRVNRSILKGLIDSFASNQENFYRRKIGSKEFDELFGDGRYIPEFGVNATYLLPDEKEKARKAEKVRELLRKGSTTSIGMRGSLAFFSANFLN